MTHTRRNRAAALAAVLAGLAVLPSAASAHPADCGSQKDLAAAPSGERYIDWGGGSDGCVTAASEKASARSAGPPMNASSAAGRKKGKFKEVGHQPLLNRGMNAALAVHEDYAYVGSRTDGGHAGQPQGGLMVVDISRPKKPSLAAGPLDPRPGESTRELRIWRSQDMLISLQTNCGVGPTLHHCTVPSISNIRYYDIGGARRGAAAAAARAEGRHARVLPVGGPGRPGTGARLRRQRDLYVRHARRRAQLPVLRLGHLGRARGRRADDALQRAVSLHPLPGGARAGPEADGRPALPDGLQRRRARRSSRC